MPARSNKKPTAVGDEFWKAQLAGKSLDVLEDMAFQMVKKKKTWHVEQLLDQGVSVDYRGAVYDKGGEYLTEDPLLLVAVRNKDRATAALLLRKGADPDGMDECAFNSPLLEAVQKNDIEMVKLLMAYNADPQLGNEDEDPLAAAEDKPEILAALQAQYPKPLDHHFKKRM